MEEGGPRVTVNIVSRMAGNGNGNQDVTAGTPSTARATSTNYLRISNYYKTCRCWMIAAIKSRTECFTLFTYLTGVRCLDIRRSTVGDNICITIRLVISTQIARLARE